MINQNFHLFSRIPNELFNLIFSHLKGDEITSFMTVDTHCQKAILQFKNRIPYLDRFILFTSDVFKKMNFHALSESIKNIKPRNITHITLPKIDDEIIRCIHAIALKIKDLDRVILKNLMSETLPIFKEFTDYLNYEIQSNRKIYIKGLHRSEKLLSDKKILPRKYPKDNRLTLRSRFKVLSSRPYHFIFNETFKNFGFELIRNKQFKASLNLNSNELYKNEIIHFLIKSLIQSGTRMSPYETLVHSIKNRTSKGLALLELAKAKEQSDLSVLKEYDEIYNCLQNLTPADFISRSLGFRNILLSFFLNQNEEHAVILLDRFNLSNEHLIELSKDLIQNHLLDEAFFVIQKVNPKNSIQIDSQSRILMMIAFDFARIGEVKKTFEAVNFIKEASFKKIAYGTVKTILLKL